MRIAIYSRKSVYTGKSESIENQIEMCKRYIFSKLEGVTENDIKVYEDEGFSAKNVDRPQFKNMLNDIRLGGLDYVVCYRLDRISRSVSDFSTLIEEFNKRGVSFVCIKEEFDTSRPMGKAMMYIASVFAQLERETIAERVRDNMLMLARTGRWLGGTAPAGLISVKTDEPFDRLKINPEEAFIVKLIFDKYLEIKSLSGVYKYLIKNGIKSRSDKFYSIPGIKEILRNPVYCAADRKAYDYFKLHGADICFNESDCSDLYGLLAYNKRDYRKHNAPRQDIDKWIIAIGKHDRLLSGEEWVKTQEMLDANKPTRCETKIHNNYALLSGMIFCVGCGGRMFAKPRSKKDAFDYICENKLRGGLGLCGSQNLDGKSTDRDVYEYLQQYAGWDKGIRIFLAKLKKEYKHEEVSQYPFMQQGNETDICDYAEKLSNHKINYLNFNIEEKREAIRIMVKKIDWDGEYLTIFN